MENLELAYRDKNVLITGGTGFIGSHLIKKLVELGANVITTYQRERPFGYFWTEGLQKKVQMFRTDVVNYQELFGLVVKQETDYIFHLAAQPIITVAYNDPYNCLQTNIMGTVNILECARNFKNITGVIVASTDKAYGPLEAGKKYKETDPLKGNHPYDVSKSCTDLISQSYYKTYGVPVTISRFANIYGQGDLNYSRIIPIIMKSIIKKNLLEIRSDGKQIRDYLNVKDVVSAYLLLGAKIDLTRGQAYNFSSDDCYSTLELLKVIEKILKKKVNYKILNIAKNELPYQSLNDDKAKRDLDWKRQCSIKNNIAETYHWYNSVL